MSHAQSSHSIQAQINQDQYYMSLAIAEAKLGIYTARPNPAVGCVLVKQGQVVGTGFHPKAGQPHAEVFALRDAKRNGLDVSDATAYVTLEPCSHTGRTPPCAKALIDAGIGRVVIAGLDPNPKVAGRGVAMLKYAGVAVTTEVLQAQAEDLNKGFLKAMRTQMPYVRLKIASSLDGRTAMASGESKWITGVEAREDVQTLRALSGAIITGSQTVIDDNPSLTVRSNQLGIEVDDIPQPKVIILDRRGRLSKGSDFQVLKLDGTQIWQVDNLEMLLSTLLTEHHIYDVLVEAGASVAGSFIQANLVDELIVYQAPCILGSTANPMLTLSIEQLSNQHRYVLVSHETVGNDLKLVYKRP